MRLARLALIALIPPLLAACGVPQLITPYRIDIQQGNHLSQEAIDQLKPGMTREQVRFLLGSPLVTDMFHADRWDYIYYRTTQRGGHEERKIAVNFKDGKLASVTGDVAPATPAPNAAPPAAPAPAATAGEAPKTPAKQP